MVETLRLSWEEYKKWSDSQIASTDIEKNLGPGPLFRGHASTKWGIKTTLERYTNKPKVECESYLNIVFNLWKQCRDNYLQKYRIIHRDIGDFSINNILEENVLELLIHLRHHGFPSPLLDWTINPYIAAFFAFYKKESSDDAAIYCYINAENGIKGFVDGYPRIQQISPINGEFHKRHINQESHYTIALKKENGSDYFCPYNYIWSPSKNIFFESISQDKLVKVEIAAHEKEKILTELYDKGITEFFLFQNEDAYFSTEAYREFKQK